MAKDSLWVTLSRALGLDKHGPSAHDKKIAALVADLRDPFPDRRRSAAWSLGKMKPPPKAAIDALTELANKDPVLAVRHSAQWALKEIRGH